jgi:two-component system sensor histidine kinase YesM
VKAFSSIRSRISLFYLLTFLPLAAASILVFFYSSGLLRSAQALFDQNLYLEQLSQALHELDRETLSYLNTRDDQALRNFYLLDARLATLVQQLPDSPSESSEQLNLRLLRRLFDRYRSEVGQAINARRGRLIERYSVLYTSSRQIIDYINLMIQSINWLDFQDNLRDYLAFSRWYNEVQVWALMVLSATALLSLLLISFFSLQLSLPLIRLSEAASDFGHGNFSTAAVESRRASREVLQLTETFNSMKERIREYIEEMKDKARIQQDLMEQNIQNLHMKHVLKSAELIALQNQINPHFLFNTINTGVQLSAVEDAPRTADYLAHLAEVYRYNLRRSDEPATLADEIASLESYIYILKIRFGDRIDFVLSVGSGCEAMLLPPVTLQPLVENAVNHGLRAVTEGGIIEVSAALEGGRLRIEVTDNGQGIEPEKIHEVLASIEVEDPLDMVMNDSQGIGLTNVLQRIRLFFGNRATIRLERREEGGTRIAFDLPRKE